MRSLFVFVFSLVLLTPAMAQDSLTLEQAIMAALKNNYDILLTRNDSASYALDNSYAWAAFLPQLNGTAATTWNRNNQQLKFSKRNGGGDSSVNRRNWKSWVNWV
jgi:outer membrane protein